MATGISGKSFIDLVKKSGVVSEEDLNKSLAQLRERGEVSLDDSEALARALVDQGVLTRWQAEKILQGKSKGFTLGQYRLLDMLGKGGMGAVYLAEHTLMRRRCAIKVLPARNVGSRSYFDRFIREAQAVAAMDHPNIVRAYDVNQARVNDTDIYFLAMEYVEGRDLQRVVDESGRPLSFTEAAEYVRQAALGLAHAHEAKMVHRDIKPANLLLNNKGVIKILDLGLAKLYDEQQQEAASLTREHNETVLGTADYLAPEQAVDSHNIDNRADIYSLGCTFYFLLTGRPPFCEGSVATRLLHHQIKPPPPIRDHRPDAPDSLVAIIDRMMAKKPEDRYQTAEEVVADLEVWLVENGNEQWREQNPELVRKVGESWRAETKIIPRSQVDTAELDLSDDDDLDLAPDDDEEANEKLGASPLTAEDSSIKKSAAASSSVHDSGLNLRPQEARAARTKPKSGIQSAPETDAGAQAQPITVELPPLETAELAPLEEIPLDVLSAEALATPAGITPLDDTSALSSGIGLSPATPQAAPSKKPEEHFTIPMPLIVGISAVAVVVVLGVFLAMIFSSRRPDRTIPPTEIDEPAVAMSHEPPPSVAPVVPPTQPAPPHAAATAEITTPDEGAAPVAANNSPSPLPPDSDANAKGPESSQPAVQFDPTPMPAKVETEPAPMMKVESTPPPPAPLSEPAPTPDSPPSTPNAFSASSAPAQAVETAPQTPAEAPSAAPAPAAPTPQITLANLDRVNVKIESNLPEGRSKMVGEEGMRTKVIEVLEGAGIREDSKAAATLQINLQTEPPLRDPREKFRFVVTAVFTSPDGAGNVVEVWSDKQTSIEMLAPQFISEMRSEVGALMRRAINERKRLRGEM